MYWCYLTELEKDTSHILSCQYELIKNRKESAFNKLYEKIQKLDRNTKTLWFIIDKLFRQVTNTSVDMEQVLGEIDQLGTKTL